MTPAVRTWLIVALTLGYLGTAHVALIHHSAALAATATAMLALLFLASVQGRQRVMLRLTVAAIGAAIVILVARGAPPLPLLLPPVLIPASVAFMFGRTLRRGSTPLVERVARGFHAPATPEPAIIRYARGVTWAWTLLLGAVAAINV